MDTPFEISQWITTFETSESRKCQTLKWVSLPVTLGAGYEALLAEFGDDAPAIYGAWILLVGIAATAPNRGVLANSKGQPYPPEFYARKSGFSVELFRRLIAWASDPNIGWLITYTGIPPKERAVPTGRKPGDNRDGIGSNVEQLSATVSPPANPPSAPPIAQPSPVAPVAKTLDTTTQPTKPLTNENPAISLVNHESGENREETGREPAGNQCLHHITSHHHTEHHITSPNKTKHLHQSINQSDQATSPSVGIPEYMRDRLDRLMEDEAFRKKVISAVVDLRNEERFLDHKKYRQECWRLCDQGYLYRIVFWGLAFDRDVLLRWFDAVERDRKTNVKSYLDVCANKELHNDFQASWNRVKAYIRLPPKADVMGASKPEPAAVSS